MPIYEVRPRKDHRGVDLISDVLPFGHLWYGEPNAISNAIGHARMERNGCKAATKAIACGGESGGMHKVCVERAQSVDKRDHGNFAVRQYSSQRRPYFKGRKGTSGEMRVCKRHPGPRGYTPCVRRPAPLETTRRVNTLTSNFRPLISDVCRIPNS
jgi:hypothetical protein